jgi:glycosyltransferase involved in cell wall biosynthesis
MRILFLHNSFPGQYGHLAAALAADPAHQVVFASAEGEGSLPGVSRAPYRAARPVRESTHPYLRWMEGAVLTGQAVYRLCHQLKAGGFVPDVVCAHSGWGPALYVKELFPACRLVGYFEWYYRTRGSDADFLDADALSEDDRCRLRTRNAALLMDLAEADAALTPTRFQQGRFPAPLQPLLTVLHDGVDSDWFRPEPGRRLRLPGLDLSEAEEIVTYATRGMEPYRGFPQFMRAAALLHRQRPNLHVVVAGDDRVVYGQRLAGQDSWRRRMLAELPDLDPWRLHFPGTLPADQYRRLLQASSAHVYLTVPFVLSWSLLDALACGCAVVGSDTEPVREVVEDGRNGLLADFASPQAIAERVTEILDDRRRAAELRQAARRTVLDRYALKDLLPRHLELITSR